MFEKHLWRSDILSNDAGLPGLYISGTLVGNDFEDFFSKYDKIRSDKHISFCKNL